MQTILSRMLVVWMAAGLTAAVSGQGTINFDNSPGAIGGTNRIRDIDGTFIGATPGPPGTNFFAQLYAAAGTGVASSALVAIGQPVNFRSGSGAGYVQVTGTTTLGYVLTPGPRSMVTIPASVLPTPGGAVTVQVRAWWAMGPGGTSITNYEAAVSSSDTNSRWGASQTLDLAATGDPTALPPTVPVNLFGFQGFQLSSTQQVTDPVITTQPQSQTVNLGEDATFTVLAGGSAPLSYQWNWNGTNLAGATSASLTLSNVQLAQAGSYAVQVTNAFGSTNSTRALLTVNPAPSCATPPSGLVSWWRGENNANDAMAGNNGTLRNGVTFSAGEAGQAFNFNGVNQYVQVSNSSSLNPSGSFSIEGWIYPRQDGVRHIITKWGDAGDQINQRSYDIATLQNRALRFDLADLANQTNIAFIYLDTPTNVLTINGWNHVAAVYDQGLGSRRIYVNGVKAAERIDAPTTVLNSTAAVSIGANVYSSTGVRSFFNGLIDELSLYAKALSEAEIQAIYGAGSAGKCVVPIAPFIIAQPTNQTITAGTSATFTVLADGSAPLSYQWNWNGTNLAGATSASLTLSNVQLAQAGSYAVQVTNAFGSTNSTQALLAVNPAPSCATPPSGLVSWWRGENNANDAVAGNNGTLRNGVTFSAGEVGQAFNFNGVNQYVQVSNNSSLNPSGSFSIEGWIYPRQDGVRHIITKWGDAGDQINQRSYDIATLQNRALRFDLADLANQTNIAFIYLDTPTNVLTINGWNHVAAVYDQGLGSRRIYVNGVKAAERIDAPITVLNSTAAVSIGANVYSSTGVRSFFNGLIDELSLYAKALSEAEIQAIYNASVSGKCRRPPTVSILSPTNGTVMLAPASFTLLAEAADDLGVTRVEFWSGTNSLGTLTNAPWYVLQTDLPPSEYHLRAVAVDILSLAATSAVSTVTVLSQPPTEPQALVTNGVLVRQTGLFYQTIHIANPTVATFAALRLWVELDTNSVAHGVRFWNATGQSNGVPYLAYNQPLTPGRSVDLSIEYFVPDRRTLPNPVFRTEVVSPESPVEPEGTFLASVRQVPLTSGLVLVEFSTIAGRIYYVQYSGDMVQWKTAMPAIVGTGTRLQWIDNGPPKTESLPSSEPSRFYRVILLP